MDVLTINVVDINDLDPVFDQQRYIVVVHENRTMVNKQVHTLFLLLLLLCNLGE